MVSGSLLNATKPQQQQTATQQPVVDGGDYIIDDEDYSSDEEPINPATGQPYKPGDMLPNGGGLWCGEGPVHN